MSSEIKVAIITASSALGAVLISGFIGVAGYYVKLKQDLKREVLTKHFERKLDVYQKALSLVTRLYQTGGEQPTIEEVRGVYYGLIMVAPSEIVRAFHKISETSAEKLRSSGMSTEQIRITQSAVAKEFIMAIRKDLFPWQKHLKLEDISFIEPKV